MKLPKLYRVVTVEFWGLRAGLGEGYGVIFDIDTKVRRRARRVATKDGWKWQLAFKKHERVEDDYCIESDVECFNECENDDIQAIY